MGLGGQCTELLSRRDRRQVTNLQSGNWLSVTMLTSPSAWKSSANSRPMWRTCLYRANEEGVCAAGIRRLGGPEYVAIAVVFLCSPRSRQHPGRGFCRQPKYEDRLSLMIRLLGGASGLGGSFYETRQGYSASSTNEHKSPIAPSNRRR